MKKLTVSLATLSIFTHLSAIQQPVLTEKVMSSTENARNKYDNALARVARTRENLDRIQGTLARFDAKRGSGQRKTWIYSEEPDWDSERAHLNALLSAQEEQFKNALEQLEIAKQRLQTVT